MKLGIVLPSRNRPQGLKRMVSSLLDNAAKPDRVRIFVGLDDDDPSLNQTEDMPNCDRVIRPPQNTVARMIDDLSYKAEQFCDATLRMDDDFICETRGWDDNCECMTGLGFWLPDDPTHPGHFMSFSGMSTQMAGWLRERQGFVHAPWFPFWFTDTWLNGLGDMASAKAVLDMKISQPEGRGMTHGLRDLPFWTEFFEGFRQYRAHIAMHLIEDLYPDGILKRTALMKVQERFQIAALLMQRIKAPEFIAKTASRAEAFEGTSAFRYRMAKTQAENVIAEAQKAA